eukprot:gene7992-1218_t
MCSYIDKAPAPFALAPALAPATRPVASSISLPSIPTSKRGGCGGFGASVDSTPRGPAKLSWHPQPNLTLSSKWSAPPNTNSTTAGPSPRPTPFGATQFPPLGHSSPMEGLVKLHPMASWDSVSEAEKELRPSASMAHAVDYRALVHERLAAIDKFTETCTPPAP